MLALAIEKSSNIGVERIAFQKKVLLVIILGFSHFVFLKRSLWALFVLHNIEK